MSFNLPDGLSKSDRIHMGIDIEPDDDYDWEESNEPDEPLNEACFKCDDKECEGGKRDCSDFQQENTITRLRKGETI